MSTTSDCTGSTVAPALVGPSNRIRARRPPWPARVPELLERVGAGEWLVWHWQPQEAAERRPALGDIEHQETLGHDLGGHLRDPPAVASEGRGLVVGPAAHRLLDDYGGGHRQHTPDMRVRDLGMAPQQEGNGPREARPPSGLGSDREDDLRLRVGRGQLPP